MFLTLLLLICALHLLAGHKFLSADVLSSSKLVDSSINAKKSRCFGVKCRNGILIAKIGKVIETELVSAEQSDDQSDEDSTASLIVDEDEEFRCFSPDLSRAKTESQLIFRVDGDKIIGFSGWRLDCLYVLRRIRKRLARHRSVYGMNMGIEQMVQEISIDMYKMAVDSPQRPLVVSMIVGGFDSYMQKFRLYKIDNSGDYQSFVATMTGGFVSTDLTHLKKSISPRKTKGSVQEKVLLPEDKSDEENITSAEPKQEKDVKCDHDDDDSYADSDNDVDITEPFDESVHSELLKLLSLVPWSTLDVQRAKNTLLNIIRGIASNGDKYTKESFQELVDEALRMDNSDNPIFVVLEEEEVVTSG